jgi:hypothetical protein
MSTDIGASRKDQTIKPLHIAAALALIGVFTFSGCGSDSSSKADTTDASAPEGTTLETNIVALADAPVKLASCDAVSTSTTDASGNSVPHLWVKIAIDNPSSKTITVSKTEFKAFDAFGKRIEPSANAFSTFEFSLTGEIGPNDSDGNFDVFDQPASGIGKVSCQITKAQFKDGSSWDAPETTD